MSDLFATLAWIGGVIAAIAVLWWAIDAGHFSWATTQYDNKRVFCKESGHGYRLEVELVHDTGKPQDNRIEDIAKEACDVIGAFPR